MVSETQQLEDRITKALVTIRRDHPLVLPTRPSGSALSGVRGRAALIKHADMDERGDDIDALTRRIDTSHHITIMLNGWVRLVAEDFDVTATLPNGADVEQMCDFLIRWAERMSEHEAALDMAEEVEGLVARIREHVPELILRDEDYRPQPVRRLIGRCTEEVERSDETMCPCQGRVFAYPDGDGLADDHDVDDPWAICERCGSRAVVSVWQRWMFPEVAAEVDGVEVAAKMRDRVLTGDEVLNLAHREFGKPAKRAALWHWVSRGQLTPIDPNTKPHTFRLGDVVDFLAAKVG